jgi:hypothetical protein
MIWSVDMINFLVEASYMAQITPNTDPDAWIKPTAEDLDGSLCN